MKNSTLINLKDKKVVVFGLGVSGVSAVKLLTKLGANVYAVNSGDKQIWAKSQNLLSIIDLDHCFSESDSLTESIMSSADLLILSPGIPRDHKILNPIHKNQTTIWGEIELGYKVIESLGELKPIIAITGTNGKTTTTTFMGEMIEAQGKKAFVGGNIGTPFCDMALEVLSGNNPYDYIVLELSSFQLESTIDFRPNIAMILNIFQNHGERYTSIEDYAAAKFNITLKMQHDDVLIYPTDYDLINQWAQKQNCKKIKFDTRKLDIQYDLKNYKLPGHHNLVNLNFVLKVCEILNFQSSLVQKCIDHFHGVHHRIEYVESQNSFKVFNDAKSTNWDATLTAIYAMEKQPKPLYLILGGKKRGHGDSILPHLEVIKEHVGRIYLIGEMALEIENEIKGKMEYKNLENLKNVINDVKGENFKGTLLFSPAFPSFDQFLNYAKRGETFVELIKKS